MIVLVKLLAGCSWLSQANFSRSGNKLESTNQGGHFLDCGFLWSYVGPKPNLHPRMEISSMTSLTPKSCICCHIFKCIVFADQKKSLTLTENLLNFNGTYMGQKQPLESFLKNGCSEQLVFWGSMRFYQFEFYLLICTGFLLYS